MKKCFFTCLAFFICAVIYGQAGQKFSNQNLTITDSLEQVLKTQTIDTVKIKTLNRLGFEFRESNSEKTLKYLKEAIELGEKIKYKPELARSYNIIGVTYIAKGRYAVALDYLLKSLRLREELLDKRGISISCIWLGNLYSNQKNFQKSLQYYFEALKIQEETLDSSGMAYTYGNIAIINYEQNKYAEALKNNFKALKIQENLKNLSACANNYNNIANIYTEEKNYPLALEYYEKCLGVRQQIGEKYGIADNYINIGNVYYKEQKYKEAIHYFNNTLDICKDIEYVKGMQYAYEGLAAAYEKLNDFKKAIQYNRLSTQMKDSIFNIESLKKITEVQTVYETEKKDLEILNLKEKEIINSQSVRQQNLIIQNRNYQIAGIAGFFLVTSIIFYLIFTRNKLKQKIIQTEVILNTRQKERSRIAKDIHDDIGSQLTRISLISEMTKLENKDNERIQTNLGKLSVTARELTQSLKEIVWAENTDYDNIESFKSFIRNYIHDFFEDAPIELRLHFPEELEATLITPDFRRNIFLILKESLNNIVKHSHATAVDITFTYSDNKYEFIISDNGLGINNEKKSPMGNGLKNMKKRMEELAGNIEFKSEENKGTTIWLTGTIS